MHVGDNFEKQEKLSFNWINMCNQSFDMFHSEILTSLNFNKNKMLSPGLENNHKLKCCSGIFPTKLCMSKLLEKYLINILVYCYSPFQGTRFRFLLKVWDRFVPYFSTFFGPCGPLDLRITIHSKVDLVFFQQSWYIWLC